MFKCIDKNGQDIFLKDTVKYEVPPDPISGSDETTFRKGTIISIPQEYKVEVQDDEGGTPFLIDADMVVVIESLTQAVYDLHNNEQLEQLLLMAEERQAQAVANATPKRRSGGGGGTKKPKANNPFA